jgi:1-acyl-sn-glycerol-3-phosphate acyltransferase
LLQAILIERHNADAKARERQLAVLVEALDAHCSLIIFPEGTRGPGPEIGPFKSGLYYLSLRRPGLELVPVHLHNLGRILPKGALLPVPLPSSVSFGRPLQLRTGEPKESLLERARLAVVNLSPP